MSECQNMSKSYKLKEFRNDPTKYMCKCNRCHMNKSRFFKKRTREGDCCGSPVVFVDNATQTISHCSEGGAATVMISTRNISHCE